MLELCDPCAFVQDHPFFRFPTHLVHPEHGKRMVWDVPGETVCPDCSTVWRSLRDNTISIAASSPSRDLQRRAPLLEMGCSRLAEALLWRRVKFSVFHSSCFLG
jgi:hypothetical protein